MSNFHIGDVISLDDGDYVVEGLSGGSQLLLRNVTSQEALILHISALSRRLAVPPKLDPVTPQPRDLERLSAKAKKEVLELALHIEEVIYGRVDADDAGRPEYNTSLPLRERKSRKVAELKSLGRKASMRSMDRWVSDYKKYGAAGLMDARLHRTTKPLNRLDDRVKDALITVIAASVNGPTVSVAKHIADMKAVLVREYPGEEISIPSESSLRRHIEILSKGKYTTGKSTNRRTAANAPKRMFSPRPAIAPGHEVQIDSSPFDVLALGLDGKPVRVKLTIALDKATMSIIATGVDVDGVKGIDPALMIAQCLTPRPSRPHSSFIYYEDELRRMPWAAHLDADQLEQYDLSRVFIKPQRIITDNGKDYISTTFTSACEQLGIDITRSSVRTPTDKAKVERSFRTVDTKFAQYLPGYLGGSVEERGLNPEKEDLLDIFTLAELFDRWVSVVWQNMPHESLRDPMRPHIVHTPNSMYMAMFDMTGFVPQPLHVDDYIALLPTLPRTIQLDGIQISYRRYDSILLHPYRLQPSGRSDTGGKWVVHYNPYNPAAVWIRHPEKPEWIECAWKNSDAFIRPFSANIRRTAREITAANPALNSEEGLNATINLIGHTKKAQAAHQRQLEREESALRLAEITGKTFPKPTTEMTLVSDQDEETDENDDDDYPDFAMFDPEVI